MFGLDPKTPYYLLNTLKSVFIMCVSKRLLSNKHKITDEKKIKEKEIKCFNVLNTAWVYFKRKCVKVKN